MKKIMFLLMLMCATLLISQSNYILKSYTFSALGGVQSGSVYSTKTSLAQLAQGDMGSNNYVAYLGFFLPRINQHPPILTSVDDVPNDQGRQVQIVWDQASYDNQYSLEKYYSIWRMDPDFVATVLTNQSSKNFMAKGKLKSKQQEISLESENTFSDPLVVIKKANENPEKTYYWQREGDVWTFVAQIPALGLPNYSYIAPTLADSSATGYHKQTYLVIFHDILDYYESNIKDGYSVDNIAPDATRALLSKTNGNLKLQWDKVEYGTFEGNRYPEINGVWYKIYASDKPVFDCDSSTYFTTTTDLEYNFPITAAMKFYKIIVSDKP